MEPRAKRLIVAAGTLHAHTATATTLPLRRTGTRIRSGPGRAPPGRQGRSRTAVMLTIDPDKVCHIIVKARALDAKTGIVEDDPGSNMAEDGMLEVLGRHAACRPAQRHHPQSRLRRGRARAVSLGRRAVGQRRGVRGPAHAPGDLTCGACGNNHIRLSSGWPPINWAFLVRRAMARAGSAEIRTPPAAASAP